jgi:hypothetical protein
MPSEVHSAEEVLGGQLRQWASPDQFAEVLQDILDEHDGPMLLHGLQEFHGRRILVSRRSDERPSSELLEERYRRFLVETSA